MLVSPGAGSGFTTSGSTAKFSYNELVLNVSPVKASPYNVAVVLLTLANVSVYAVLHDQASFFSP